MARNRLLGPNNHPRGSRTADNSIITANKNESNLIIAEMAYRNRKSSQEINVAMLKSSIDGKRSHISDTLNNVHAVRLGNMLPLHILYPDLILEKFYGAVVFGLWTSGDSQKDGNPDSLPSPRNLSLPDTDQQININVVLVDDLDQFLLDNGAQYLNLQERIGKNFYKLPAQIFIKDEVLPVRTLMPTVHKNHIGVQHQFFPVKFLYNENFYIAAHQAGLYSGIEATTFCYNYIGDKPLIAKSDNVIGGGEDFLYKDKVENRKSTDIIYPHPLKSDTDFQSPKSHE